MNHGIEIHESNVEFARGRVAEFLSTSDAIFERDFCKPHFMVGNIFNLVPPVTRQSPEPQPNFHGDESQEEAPDAEDDGPDFQKTGEIAIEPPPMCCKNGERDFWPTYDRIYVGSEISSSSQMEAILRLLKVGGSLVAPYNDDVSFNIISCYLSCANPQIY